MILQPEGLRVGVLKGSWELVWQLFKRSTQVHLTMCECAILAELTVTVCLHVKAAHRRLVVVVGDTHHPVLGLLWKHIVTTSQLMLPVCEMTVRILGALAALGHVVLAELSLVHRVHLGGIHTSLSQLISADCRNTTPIIVSNLSLSAWLRLVKWLIDHPDSFQS